MYYGAPAHAASDKRYRRFTRLPCSVPSRAQFAAEFLERNAHELASAARARFVKDVFQGGFQGAFRNLQLSGDFFVAKTFEAPLQYGSLTSREGFDGSGRWLRPGCIDQRIQAALVNPSLTRVDLSN